jgi:hypothetical protein
MVPALKAAGLPVKLRTYDLRHSHASILIDLGANPLKLAQRMGHTDPAITLKVYGHLFDGAQEKLTEEIDALRAQAERNLERRRNNVVQLNPTTDLAATYRAYATA